MALKSTKPMQSIQKAVSPKAAKLGKMPAKMMAKNTAKTTAKTKKVAKVPTNVKGKKLTRNKRPVAIKGKPLTKRTAKRVVKAY